MLGKSGVPRPVTGSHPCVLLKPGVPQPRLPPFVISFMTCGFAYSTGLTNPTGAFFALMRCSLIMFSKLAKVGQDAEVPNARENLPLTAVT